MAARTWAPHKLGKSTRSYLVVIKMAAHWHNYSLRARPHFQEKLRSGITPTYNEAVQSGQS